MKKKIIIGTIIIAVIALFVAVNISKSKDSVTTFGGGKAFEVNVVKVEKGNISATISANGVTEQIQKNEVYFDSPMKVLKVMVEINQKVTKGQKLLEIDMDSLNSEYAQLLTNKVIQELAVKKLENSKDENNTSENSIKSAENNVKSAGNNVKTAENNVKNSENTLKEYNKSYEDNLALFNADALSQSDLDKSKKVFEDGKVALDDAKIALDNAHIALESAITAFDNTKTEQNNKKTIHDNTLMTKEIDTKTQEQTLKATILKITDIENKIKKINEALQSPIDGVISEINVGDGTYTSAAQPVIKIVNSDRLRVKAKVSEYNIKNIKVGQLANITGDAIDKNEKITGKVTSISPNTVLNATSNGQETVVEVILELNNTQYALRSGLNVNCEIETSQKKDVIVTGMEIFDEDKDSNKFVYVVDSKKNIMLKKPVTLGITSDMNAEIISGLNVGDIVVLYPKPVYKDGAKIKILKDVEK